MYLATEEFVNKCVENAPKHITVFFGVTYPLIFFLCYVTFYPQKVYDEITAMKSDAKNSVWIGPYFYGHCASFR